MKNFQGPIQGRQAPIGVMEYLWKLKQYLRATKSHRLNFLTFIRRQQRMSLFLCFNLKNCYRKQFSRTSAAQTFLKQMTVGSQQSVISPHILSIPSRPRLPTMSPSSLVEFSHPPCLSNLIRASRPAPLHTFLSTPSSHQRKCCIFLTSQGTQLFVQTCTKHISLNHIQCQLSCE